MKSLLLALLLMPLAAHAADPPATKTTDAAFEAIYTAEWTWRTQQAPSWDEDSDNSGPDAGADH